MCKRVKLYNHSESPQTGFVVTVVVTVVVGGTLAVVEVGWVVAEVVEVGWVVGLTVEVYWGATAVGAIEVGWIVVTWVVVVVVGVAVIGATLAGIALIYAGWVGGLV